MYQQPSLTVVYLFWKILTLVWLSCITGIYDNVGEVWLTGHHVTIIAIFYCSKKRNKINTVADISKWPTLLLKIVINSGLQTLTASDLSGFLRTEIHKKLRLKPQSQVQHISCPTQVTNFKEFLKENHMPVACYNLVRSLQQTHIVVIWTVLWQ